MTFSNIDISLPPPHPQTMNNDDFVVIVRKYLVTSRCCALYVRTGICNDVDFFIGNWNAFTISGFAQVSAK